MESLFPDSVVSGNGKLQFSLPYGLSTDEYNGDIYICDHRNNRIQIISEIFEYKSEFGEDILHYPFDVKLYKDNIFILDAIKSMFTHIQQRSSVTEECCY